MKTYRYLTSALILAWFLTTFTLAATGGFSNARNRLGIAVALGALLPLIAFVVWFAVSKSFRQFTLSLSPVLLTASQFWRLIGFAFVLLEAHHALPALFALPAGYGDMFIGATAVFAAWKFEEPRRRTPFITWQLLGVLDLVLAVTLGTTAPFLAPHGITTSLMTVLPLSLIPTFFVPLFLILHIICIAQAARWPSRPLADREALGPVHPLSAGA